MSQQISRVVARLQALRGNSQCDTCGCWHREGTPCKVCAPSPVYRVKQQTKAGEPARWVRHG